MSGRATLVRKLDGFTGDARLYRLEPALEIKDWDDNVTGTTDHVVVSATVVVGIERPETYIFAADASGAVTSWSELPGSMNGVLDHAAALADAGYEVVS